MNKEVYIAALAFRKAEVELIQLRKAAFPVGSIVCVNGSNYGIVGREDGCPADQLPVRFENGNTWWKPVERCVRQTDVKLLPRWVRRMKLNHHGIQTL